MNLKSILLFILVLAFSNCSFSVPLLKSKTRYTRHEVSGYSDIIEETRFIQGRLTFCPVQSGVIRQVLITRPSGAKEVANWGESINQSIVIDPDKKYNVELITTTSTNPDIKYNEIMRIYHKDKLIVDASICYLHGFKMNRQFEQTVALEDYRSNLKEYFVGNNFTPKYFPNDGKTYLGCSVGPKWLTWHCPLCFHNSEEWRKCKITNQ